MNKVEAKQESAKLPPLDKAAPLAAEPEIEDLGFDDDEIAASEPEDLVRLVNKLPRLLHLPDKITTASGPEGPRITGVGSGKSLQPGGNNVPRELWERLKGQPHGAPLDPRITRGHARKQKGTPGHGTVREWLRLGFIVEEGDVSQPEGPEAPRDLLAYGVATASTLAEGEDNPEILARWLKAETRPDVQAAVRRQLQAVGAGRKQN